MIDDGNRRATVDRAITREAEAEAEAAAEAKQIRLEEYARELLRFTSLQFRSVRSDQTGRCFRRFQWRGELSGRQKTQTHRRRHCAEASGQLRTTFGSGQDSMQLGQCGTGQAQDSTRV